MTRPDLPDSRLDCVIRCIIGVEKINDDVEETKI